MSATAEPERERKHVVGNGLLNIMELASPFCVEACHVVYDVYLDMLLRDKSDVTREQLLRESSLNGLQNLVALFFNERYHAYFQHTDADLEKDVARFMEAGPFRCVSCLLRALWVRCNTIIQLSHSDITSSPNPESNLRTLLTEWNQGFLAMLLCMNEDDPVSHGSKVCTGVDKYDPAQDLIILSFDSSPKQSSDENGGKM